LVGLRTLHAHSFGSGGPAALSFVESAIFICALSMLPTVGSIVGASADGFHSLAFGLLPAEGRGFSCENPFFLSLAVRLGLLASCPQSMHMPEMDANFPWPKTDQN
jgi:hypothetical protein